MGLHWRAVHKVGVVASLAGAASLLALGFASISQFRIATGVTVSVFEALNTAQALAVFTPWVATLVLSRRAVPAPAVSLARGLAASLAILGVFWVSGSAAERLLADEGALARYSIGGGVWLSVFWAFALIMASRRELSRQPSSALVLTAAAPVGLIALVLTGRLSSLGLAAECRNVSGEFTVWVAQHLTYSAIAMAVAILVGVTLGVLAHARPRLADGLLLGTSVFQTIPGLAMIGILAVPLGMLSSRLPAVRALGVGVLGWAPVVIALTLYALLAVVRNTYAGLNSVPEETIEAARGMGMSGHQLLRKVQLPLSAPVILSGIRTAAQQTIGNATLGVFVAAGTLGRPIFGGVSQTADDLVLLGSIALVVLAIGVDIGMRGLQRMVTPRHLRSAG